MDSRKSDSARQNETEPFEQLLAAARDTPVALLHSCGEGPTRLFTEPVEVLRLAAGNFEAAWDELDRFLEVHRGRPCVGYLGYDLRDAVEPLARTIPEDLPIPILHFTAFGHEQVWGPCAVPAVADVPPASGLRAHTTRADYEERVARVVEHIRAGDIFQANLTQPFTGTYRGDPRLLFWRLCHRSPAPFSAYLETGDGVAVLSSSPEEFLSLEGRDVRTLPIKGTRGRSDDPAEDRALLDELLRSEKDQAELAMIVDLMRNDLGKVAEVGSVEVGPFPEHASFAQVHHLFARVTAKLREDVGVVDLLRATFPPGSITGAPKLRCMEILEQLELVRRGVYTGAIGWIGPGPRMHLNVAIRTMVHVGDVVRFNTGGGVTADSDPVAEFDETLAKARGMVAALQTEIERS